MHLVYNLPDQGAYSMNATIVGGGSPLWGKSLAPDLCIHSHEDMGGVLTLYDLNPEALAVAKQYYRRCNEAGGSRWEIKTTTDLYSAMNNADYVITTFNHGGLRGTEIDLTVPDKFGIVQIVGDTVGPSGLSRATRNIPAIVRIARHMQDYSSPGAIMLNCSNPMTLMCMAAESVIPGQVIGYCHEWRLLKPWICELMGLDPETDLHELIFGLNHFAAVLGLTHEGNDHFLDDVVERITDQEPLSMTNDEFDAMSPFDNKRELTRHLAELWGILMVPGDRHVAEFMPQLQFLDCHSAHALRHHLIKSTTFAHRIDGATNLVELFGQLADGSLPIPDEHSPEQIDHIIAALAGIANYRTNVVVPGHSIGNVWFNNTGNHYPFPGNVFMEATCGIEEGPNVWADPDIMSQTQYYTGRAAKWFKLTQLHATICSLIYQGIAQGDHDSLLNAMDLDPMTTACLPWNKTASLLRELTEANQALMNQ